MRKKMYLILLFLIAIAFTSVGFKVNAAVEANLVIINPGEDSSTQMNINYHVNSKNTFVIYSESPTLDGEIKTVIPECTPVPFDNMEDVYQCSVELEGLKPNTKYYFDIGGAPLKEIRSFVTAGGDEFTFAHVTDIHSYRSGTANTRVATANKVLNKMNEVKEFDFIVASGDVTAYGTVYEQWETLYGMDLLKSNMFAVTPGNHDYYNTSAKVVSIDYFNSVTNNPKNGAPGVINSSYYFKYGNTLFISLNSEEAANNATLRANQIKWLNEVTANNPADFIIAFTHRPFYTGDGRNAGQANDMRSYFQDVFDKTGVDLVLGGHNHVYARSYQVYENQKVENDSEGTVYITGIQIGDRYQPDPGTKPALVEYALSGAGQDGGTVITVGKDKIELEFVQVSGIRLFPGEIHSKSSNIDNNSIKNSFSTKKVNDDVVIDIDPLTPGIIKKIDVYNNKNELLLTELNPTKAGITLKNAPKVGYLDLKLKALLRNGEILDIDLEAYDERYDFGTISNFEIVEEELQTTLQWDATINKDNAVRYELFVNGELLKQLDLDQESTVLDKVSPYKVNEIELKIIGKDDNVLFVHNFTYGEKTADLHVVFNYEEIEVTAGEELNLEYTVFPEQDVKLEFVSSDPEIATVDNNGKVTAHKEGTVTIKLNVVKRWDVNSEVTVKVNPAVEEPAPKPEKKGCFSSGYLFTGLAVLGLTFILRRRK